MTSPKRKRNMSGYDAAVRALAGMNQDIMNLRNFIQPPTLGAYSRVDEVLEQLRLDHTNVRQALLPPLIDPVAPLKDIILATDHVHDVLAKTSVSMDIGDMVHESWREQVGSPTDLSAQLDAAVKFSLGENTLHLAATETFLVGTDFDLLKDKFDIPVSTFSAMEKSLSDSTASFRALLESLEDLTQLVQIPSFVLPGATFALYTTGNALRALDPLVRGEDEEIEEEITSISWEYVENLDIVGLLNLVNPDLLPMYYGAEDDLYGNRPDRARHVLASLRALSIHFFDTLAPEPDVNVWLKEHGTQEDLDNQGGPKRHAKVRYILRSVGQKPLTKFVQDEATVFEDIYRLFHKLHGKNPNLANEQLLAIFRKTVASLTFFIQTWASSEKEQDPPEEVI